MLDKYKSQGFVVLAINTQTAESAVVLKLMKEKKVDFITLKTPHDKWAMETYKVTGTPANFLLDGEGRVIFTPRVHDTQTAKVFEMEIQTILKHSGNTAKQGSN